MDKVDAIFQDTKDYFANTEPLELVLQGAEYQKSLGSNNSRLFVFIGESELIEEMYLFTTKEEDIDECMEKIEEEIYKINDDSFGSYYPNDFGIIEISLYHLHLEFDLELKGEDKEWILEHGNPLFTASVYPTDNNEHHQERYPQEMICIDSIDEADVFLNCNPNSEDYLHVDVVINSDSQCCGPKMSFEDYKKNIEHYETLEGLVEEYMENDELLYGDEDSLETVHETIVSESSNSEGKDSESEAEEGEEDDEKESDDESEETEESEEEEDSEEEEESEEDSGDEDSEEDEGEAEEDEEESKIEIIDDDN